MSDRYIVFTVTLTQDFRDDDAEPIKQAIGMIKGVRSVVPVVADPTYYAACDKVRREAQVALEQALVRLG